MLFIYEGKESKAPRCPTSTSEHPVRWYPGHQPGKVDTGRNLWGKAGFWVAVSHASARKGCWTGFSMGVTELNTFSFHFSNKKKNSHVVQSKLSLHLSQHSNQINQAFTQIYSWGSAYLVVQQNRVKERKANTLLASLPPLFPPTPKPKDSGPNQEFSAFISLSQLKVPQIFVCI